MAKEVIRVGVASSDGIVVNRHFGRADKFLIYQIENENDISLVDVRNVYPVCEGGNHDDNNLRKTAESLTDLQAVIVSRIGQGARNILSEKNIETYELPMLIDDALEKIVSYRKVQLLLQQVFA